MAQPPLSPKFASFVPTLEQACHDLSLALTPEQHHQLLYYLQQLLFWNKAYNLTAIKDERQALIKHIVDSLSIVPYFQSSVQKQKFDTLLDVGTGAGLPAVIVAICCPALQVTALDSNSKKIRFIKQVVSELGLKNVIPMASRIEEHKAKYSAITSRAFASLTDFVTVTQDKLADNGQILAMKGVLPTEEIDSLNNNWAIQHSKLNVPNLDEERHLIILQKI